MIVPATPFHATALAGIHAGAFPAGEAWSEAALATQLTLPGGFGFTDLTGGFVLARAAADEAEVLTLAVLPERRRQGCARALLAAVIAAAAERDARHLLLEVATTNPAARALYASFGFTEVGRRRRYYADGADALILSLKL